MYLMNNDTDVHFIITRHNPYVGRLATGRVHMGYVKIGDPIHVINQEGQKKNVDGGSSNGKVTKM